MKKKYILITPAYNEEDNIERVINSVIAQTILPQKWLIINDASTDATGEIISRYAAQYDYITQFERTAEKEGSYYKGKTYAFLAGYEEVRDSIEYDFIGCLDADIALKPSYYEGILQEFDRNPRLGIAGGVYIFKIGNQIKKTRMDKLCVPGSLQLFRRECYEQTNGYTVLEYGDDDTLIGIVARMNGWETRNFTAHEVVQHRIVGTRIGKSFLKAKLRQGFSEYQLGAHPAFMLAKSLYRFFWERPFFLASAARLIGYFYAHLRRDERCIPDEVVKFLRKEQLSRLRACLSRS